MAISSTDKKELSHRYQENLEESKSELIAFIKQNIEDYPEYANSPCAGQQMSSKPYYAFENKKENKFFAP
jgi:hypothetical protein